MSGNREGGGGNVKPRNRLAGLCLAVVAAVVPAIDPALAHRFNVALVMPLSGAASDQGRQIRNGFMLATRERDSHPDQDSDGHLGGLDVYVSVIDAAGNVAADIRRMATHGAIDIVAAVGTGTRLPRIARLLDGKNVALLSPGRSPFAQSDLPAVAAFVAAYGKEFGVSPTSRAARGYHAARRLGAAVRAQGGVGDRASLRRHFRKSRRDFAW